MKIKKKKRWYNDLKKMKKEEKGKDKLKNNNN